MEGTGHGVGAHLNVHEGPQSISTRYYITTPLAAKMFISACHYITFPPPAAKMVNCPGNKHLKHPKAHAILTWERCLSRLHAHSLMLQSISLAWARVPGSCLQARHLTAG
eukprot:1138248-Pelagomonas_calceolata.AAC.4